MPCVRIDYSIPRRRAPKRVAKHPPIYYQSTLAYTEGYTSTITARRLTLEKEHTLHSLIAIRWRFRGRLGPYPNMINPAANITDNLMSEC
jgi:hypothetical protein